MSGESRGRISLELVGLSITVLYLLGVTGFVFVFWEDFRGLKPNEWGDFLAGSVGPVALAWIVLSFLLQGRELKNSVDALRLQTDELQASVQQQKELVRVTETQLQLDRIAREREAEIMLEHRMPHMILKFGRVASTSGGGTEAQINAHNVGASAQSVSFAFDAASAEIKGAASKLFHAVDQGDEVSFRIVSRSPHSQDIGGDLHIFSSNIRGETKSQLFRINHPHIEQIDVSYPRN